MDGFGRGGMSACKWERPNVRVMRILGQNLQVLRRLHLGRVILFQPLRNCSSTAEQLAPSLWRWPAEWNTRKGPYVDSSFDGCSVFDMQTSVWGLSTNRSATTRLDASGPGIVGTGLTRATARMVSASRFSRQCHAKD